MGLQPLVLTPQQGNDNLGKLARFTQDNKHLEF